MRHAQFFKRTFKFKQPSGTSRGVLVEKNSWFIEVWDTEKPKIKGIGECSVIPGLSPDFSDERKYEEKLTEVCLDLSHNLDEWPSIKFGVECALLDLKNHGEGVIFKNNFSIGIQSIPINGLIWMGEESFMRAQIESKLNAGFSTLKMKIGAIDFEKELSLLKSIRNQYSAKEITLRVDANGSFSTEDAIEKLNRLSELDIHSIEQPIKPGNWDDMAKLCLTSPVKIALDEELIGVYRHDKKIELLEKIKPHFIILKPSLHGGITGTKEWIRLAEERSIDWWITSALESNIGLNAICQLAAQYDNPLPQGLGTGSLYVTNMNNELHVANGFISRVVS